MLEIRDANRRAVDAHTPMAPTGSTRASTRGTGIIESPLKRERSVTRDDIDESTPRRGPASLDAEAYRPGGENRLQGLLLANRKHRR